VPDGEPRHRRRRLRHVSAASPRESLTIAGWVAMWRPMQIYLYDWWPVRRRGKLYQKLSRMHVDVRKKT